MGIVGIGLLIYFYNEKKKIDEQCKQLFFLFFLNFSFIKLDARNNGAFGDVKLGGPFSLLNQFNEPFTDAHLTGKYSLFYFGFTHCPDICPDELDKISDVIKILDSDKKTKDMIVPVFVTCDPERDNPAILKEYLSDFHPKIIGLTGKKEDVLDLAKKYRIYFKAGFVGGEGNYLVDHSIFIFFMGKNGEFIDFFGSNLTSKNIAEQIKEYMKEGK